MGLGSVGHAGLTASATDSAAEAERKLPPRSRRWVKVAAVVVLIVVVRVLIAGPARVRSSSMEPTYHDGDVVLIDELSYRLGEPGRGDVVIAEIPSSDGDVIKRVVGIAGDTVGIEDGVLVVNGEAVGERYIFGQDVEGTFFGPVDVPDGHVFLLGDNRNESVDSRAFGPVPVDAVGGIVRLRLWPPG